MKHEHLHNTFGWDHLYTLLEKQYRQSPIHNDWTKMWSAHKKEAEKTVWFTEEVPLREKLESRRGDLLLVALEILNGEE